MSQKRKNLIACFKGTQTYIHITSKGPENNSNKPLGRGVFNTPNK